MIQWVFFTTYYFRHFRGKTIHHNNIQNIDDSIRTPALFEFSFCDSLHLFEIIRSAVVATSVVVGLEYVRNKCFTFYFIRWRVQKCFSYKFVFESHISISTKKWCDVSEKEQDAEKNCSLISYVTMLLTKWTALQCVMWRTLCGRQATYN